MKIVIVICLLAAAVCLTSAQPTSPKCYKDGECRVWCYEVGLGSGRCIRNECRCRKFGLYEIDSSLETPDDVQEEPKVITEMGFGKILCQRERCNDNCKKKGAPGGKCVGVFTCQCAK